MLQPVTMPAVYRASMNGQNGLEAGTSVKIGVQEVEVQAPGEEFSIARQMNLAIA